MRSGTIAWVALLVAGALVLLGDAPIGRARQAEGTPTVGAESSVEGLVVVESANEVSETIDRLEAALAENGLTVVARVDHAANAEGAGEELRPTQLLIFGNPALGTGLMQSAQTAGIDLPQKFLAWEAEDGRVYLAYNDPAYVVDRHGIDDRDEIVGQITDALAMLAAGATAADGTPTP